MISFYSGNVPKYWDADYCFPENGLHPNEQVRMAEKLVEEGKDKDISVLTYSAIIVNALDVYCRLNEVDYQAYYCDGNFHGFETFKVHEDDLWIIYQNLGKCYSDIEDLEIELMFK